MLVRSVGFVIVVIAIVATYLASISSRTFATHEISKSAVIITGSSSGIGFFTAEYLADRGFIVYSCVRKKDDFEKFKGNKNIVPVLLDVTELATIQSSLRVITSDLIDRPGVSLVGLVNNAGVGYLSAVEETDMTAMRHVFDVNVFGLVEVTQVFLPILRETDGSRIVNIGSVSGFFSARLFGAYGASKYCVEAISDILRMEVVDFNISVSLLEPGSVESQIRVNSKAASNNHTLPQDDEALSLYQAYYDQSRKRLKALDDDVDSPLGCAEAILHALTSPSPKTRYLVARVGKLPVWMVRILSNVLPDRLMDHVKTGKK